MANHVKLVHLNQLGFGANLVESFFQESRNATPTATPYRSGVPIDSIAPSTDEDDSPAQLRCTAAYQSLIGSIGWLSNSTHPDLSAVHSFLASYSIKPSVGHMRAALYALHYIHSTHDYGISFTSDSVAPMHSYIQFPPSTDVEAFTDASPPTLTNSSTLSSYSDACWGLQIGNAVTDDTLLPLFKFRSMSGGIIFGMAALLVGLVTVKTTPLSALLRSGFGQQILLPKRWWTFATCVKAWWTPGTSFPISPLPLFFSTTTILVYDGRTT